MAGLQDLIQGLISRNTSPSGGFSGVQPLTGLASLLQSSASPAAMVTNPPPPAPPRMASGGWEPGGQYPQGMPTPPAQQPANTGFPHQDAKHRIIGIIGDALSGFAGQPGVYAAEMGRRRAQQDEAQLRQQQWQAEQEYKRLHPDPTALQRNTEYLDSLEPGLGGTYAHNEADPYKGIQTTDQYGNPSISLYRPGAMAGGAASGGITAAHIAALRAHPDMASEFDAKFGPGSAAKILGGAGQGGPPTFPAGR